MIVPLILLAAVALASLAGFVLQHRQLRAMRREARRYRAIAEHVSDIIVVQEQGKVVFTSGAVDRLLGRRPEELGVGQYLNSVHPEDVEIARTLEGIPPQGVTRSATYRAQAVEGHYVWFEVSTRGIYSKTGEFLQEVSVGRDVTERKEAELKIIAAQERAEAASKAKSSFLAIMSHELRTPLNAVIGFSEILKTEMFGPVGNTRYKDYVESIHSSGKHLLGVINDILDMTKLDTEQLALEREPVDLRQVFADCQPYIAPLAEQGGVALTIDIPPLTIDADCTRVRQIVFNLLSNAVKFSPPGGAVRATAQELDDTVQIAIADTGIGMKPEDIPKALERFGQIDSALNRKYEGVGLGLPLTKQLVELHGGSLAIDSAPNVGTAVTITLPLASTVAARNAA